MSSQPDLSLASAAGIHAIRCDDPSATELRLCTRSPGVADAAALVDFGLGASLRALLGSGQRLPTITLTLELDQSCLTGVTSVRAWAGQVHDGVARAHGLLIDRGDQIGQCSATFAVPRHGNDLEPMPWDTSQATPSLKTAQSASAETILEHACIVEDDKATLHPQTSMLNRWGVVQGAALFRLAASSPRRHIRFITGHLQFVAAAESRSDLTATRTVTGDTGRSVFVQAIVRQKDDVVAAGTFVFRKERVTND